ncbi:MAG TPA: response regulator transcription factor [Candidatus Limnocylindrales bacterium]|nr:response regulator transcription factor [Candidatus Limnocylindrales bacterium]
MSSNDQSGDGAARDDGSATRSDSPATPSSTRPVRVLLVDDHRLVLESLARVLDEEPDINIVGTATTVAEAKEVAREPVDVVLMDYRLPDGTGVEATRTIKARWPGSRIIMLTAVDDDETILESIQAGADGYLTKDKAIHDVVTTVRAANAGATLLPREMIVTIAKRVAESRDRQAERTPVEALTPRELEVLKALVEGLSTPEICERLVITPNTLRTHVQNIMGKLHVHSKLEAVAFALRHRLVEPPRA